MHDILHLVRISTLDNAISLALARGIKIVELDTHVVFTDQIERLAIYFSDDSKSTILRAFIGDITTAQT